MDVSIYIIALIIYTFFNMQYIKLTNSMRIRWYAGRVIHLQKTRTKNEHQSKKALPRNNSERLWQMGPSQFRSGYTKTSVFHNLDSMNSKITENKNTNAIYKILKVIQESFTLMTPMNNKMHCIYSENEWMQILMEVHIH